MTNFASLLSHLIGEKGISVYTLSKSTGIDRSFLQKMKNGLRLPANHTTALSLAKAMMLTPKETTRFMEAYYQAQMGERKYEQRRLVGTIISNFDSQSASGAAIQTFTKTTIQLKEHFSVIRGQPEVHHAIQALLDMESSRKNGRIRLITQPSFQFVNDAISRLHLSHSHARVEHLICFDKENWEAQYYNLDMFRKLVPLLFVQENYVPYFTHEYVASLYNTTSFLPYLVLTSTHAMHISYDMREAVLYDREDLVAMVQENFDKKLAQASRLFHSVNTEPAEYFEQLRSLVDFEEFTLTLMYQPSLAPFCPPGILKRALGALLTPPRIENTFETIAPFFASLHDHAPQLMQSFTLQGLNQFMETGYSLEIPRTLIQDPLPPEWRLRILRAFIRRFRAGQVHAHIIKSELLYVPPQMRLTSYAPTVVALRYFRQDGQIFLLTPKESSLVNAFRDFLNWLPESYLVYDEPTTLSLMERCYQHYEETSGITLPPEEDEAVGAGE